MRRKTIYALLFLAFLVSMIVTWQNRKQKVVEIDTVTEAAKDAEIKEIPVFYEKEMGDSCVDEVRKAFCFLPGEAVSAFVDEGWQVVIGREKEADGSPGAMTDFDKKTVQVVMRATAEEDAVFKETLHGLCHYLDHYAGDLSEQSAWKTISEEFQGSFPEEGEIDHIEVLSHQKERFALFLGEYFLHPEELQEDYPDLYGYFKREARF